MTPDPGRVLLVGGHESLAGRSLHDLVAADGPGVCGAGRELGAAIGARPGAVVVPMTLGRDPGLVETAAQTLRWAARDRPPGSFLLTEPLGTAEHLVGWIRAAVVHALRADPPPQAVLLVAPAAGPGPDAELFRVARLVWQHLPVRWVEVALTGGEPDVAEGLERCRRLGARSVVRVPASFVRPDPRPGGPVAGPLLGPAALAELVRGRVAAAERRWTRHGDDGLSAGRRHAHDHDFHESTMTSLEGAVSHAG